jgi:hypothetical protein
LKNRAFSAGLQFLAVPAYLRISSVLARRGITTRSLSRETGSPKADAGSLLAQFANGLDGPVD